VVAHAANRTVSCQDRPGECVSNRVPGSHTHHPALSIGFLPPEHEFEISECRLTVDRGRSSHSTDNPVPHCLFTRSEMVPGLLLSVVVAPAAHSIVLASLMPIDPSCWGSPETWQGPAEEDLSWGPAQPSGCRLRSVYRSLSGIANHVFVGRPSASFLRSAFGCSNPEKIRVGVCGTRAYVSGRSTMASLRAQLGALLVLFRPLLTA